MNLLLSSSLQHRWNDDDSAYIMLQCLGIKPHQGGNSFSGTFRDKNGDKIRCAFFNGSMYFSPYAKLGSIHILRNFRVGTPLNNDFGTIFELQFNTPPSDFLVVRREITLPDCSSRLTHTCTPPHRAP